MLAADLKKLLQAFPGRGVPVSGPSLNSACQFPGWNNKYHRGWYAWRLLRMLMKQGLVKQVQGGRGRLSIYVLC